MTILAALLLGLLVGAVLGTLGGGGAILTVPLLVYLLGQPAHVATTSALVIVGATAVVGVAGHARSGQVRWKAALLLGVVGVGTAAVGTELNSLIDENALLLGFAGVMVLAAAAMSLQLRISGRTAARLEEKQLVAALVGAPGPGALGPGRTGGTDLTEPDDLPTGRVLAVGLVVGLLTGVFGVGGGFLIVPALVLVLGMPMHVAAATSLVVIALNSTSSLVARAGSAQFDWEILVPFTLAAMVASLAGGLVAEKLPGHLMQRGFVVLLVLVAGYVTARVLVL